MANVRQDLLPNMGKYKYTPNYANPAGMYPGSTGSTGNSILYAGSKNPNLTSDDSSGLNGLGGLGGVGYYNLDLSAYDKLLGALGNNFNNSKGILNQRLNQALDSLNKSRKRGAQDFNSGRATIAENSYDRQRQQINDLAARGLAGSGLQQLGDVQEAMAKGREMSTLANNYYAYLSDLQDKENEANLNYNTALAELQNAYNSNVANVEFQRQNTINDYNRNRANFNASQAKSLAEQTAQSATNTFNELTNAFSAFDILYGNDPETAKAMKLKTVEENFGSFYQLPAAEQTQIMNLINVKEAEEEAKPKKPVKRGVNPGDKVFVGDYQY